MSTHLAAANLASFAIQIAVLVSAGAMLIRLFRIDAPRAAFACWRTLLATCLLLPFCQPWRIADAPPLTVATTVASSAVAAQAAAPALLEPPDISLSISIEEVALLVLGAGIAARVLWLTVGAYGLWRLRRRAAPVDPLPESIRLAQERVGVEARFYRSADVSGPLTFGVFRPAIVIPPSVEDMPRDVQEAIACHELLHVRRRDWVFELIEEAVATVLWFHPAIWLLIARIRLAREQVVDAAVIALTESRERYVESLLAVARARLFPSLTPASPFLRRHLLKRRVARILEESTMTTRRLIASLAATGAALTLAATFAVRSFPLEAQGRSAPPADEPVQLVAGAEHLLHGDRPEYPRRAIEQRVEGDVIVDMTLNERGEVSDAHIVSGPEELRRTTLASVLQWHYSPAALRSTETQATLRFRLAGIKPEPIEIIERKRVDEGELTELDRMKMAAHRMEEIEKALEDPALTDSRRVELKMMADKNRAELAERRGEAHEFRSGEVLFKVERARGEVFAGNPKITDVRTERVPAATVRELMEQAGLAIGDVVTVDSAKRMQEAARALDEHLEVEFRKEKSGIVVTVLAR